MNIIIIGPQGSGKGTQAKFISEKFSIPHICTGDLFRSLEGDLRERLNLIINKGELVPDDLTLEILQRRINQQDAQNGIVLDGYPRNINQSELLKSIVQIDTIINITLSDEEAINRLSSRLSCKCGAVFNKITNPPKQQNICNNCQSQLYQREDDKPEAIKKRLETYKQQTQPIINHYKENNIEVITINGDQPINIIKEEIEERLTAN
tara:strand:- start:78 stop:701 length:624 start_codon:yes stop_codon:yes gene_type:complete